MLSRLIPNQKFQGKLQFVSVNLVIEDVKNLSRVLVTFNQREKAAKLQSAFGKYLELVTASLPMLTPIEVPDPNAPVPNSNQNKAKAKPPVVAPIIPNVDWKLTLFE